MSICGEGIVMVGTPPWSAHGHPRRPLEPDRSTDHPCGPTPEGLLVAAKEHPASDRGLWAVRSTPVA